jgi:hypothetical protein
MLGLEHVRIREWRELADRRADVGRFHADEGLDFGSLDADRHPLDRATHLQQPDGAVEGSVALVRGRELLRREERVGEVEMPRLEVERAVADRTVDENRRRLGGGRCSGRVHGDEGDDEEGDGEQADEATHELTPLCPRTAAT